MKNIEDLENKIKELQLQVARYQAASAVHAATLASCSRFESVGCKLPKDFAKRRLKAADDAFVSVCKEDLIQISPLVTTWRK